MHVLVDDFSGDPQEFYALVKEEVEKREVPDATFSDDTEVRGKKGGIFGALTAGTERTKSFVVSDKQQSVKILAYRFGRGFLVTTHSFWTDLTFAKQEKEGKLFWLESVYSGCFTETVNRAVKAALARYLKNRQVAVPASLDPKEIFYSREARGE